MLYTRSGDKGQTTVFACPPAGGACLKKFSKSSPRIEVLGSLDEINSLLGFCKTRAKNQKNIYKILEGVQSDLFIIQAEVAGCGKKFKKNRIKEIEKIIDGIERKLPKIRSFIIPGGTEISALLDYTRAVARKAERRAAALKGKDKVSKKSLQYLNRLSSLLFALARLVNSSRGIKEKSPTY